MSIEIRKEDIIPYVYFVCSMAQQTKTGMYGVISSKSDFVGGIFDRWINIIPESLIFNKHLLPIAQNRAKSKKNVKVFSDFFMYDPKIVGIAPDVIGLQIDDKIIPFVKYDDQLGKKKYWISQPHTPQIEVKSFFGKKYMVSLRDQHYGDKFLVMVEADMNVDYLLSFFDKSIFKENDTNKLKMPNDFILSNTQNLLSQTKQVEFSKTVLGNLNLLTVTTVADFKTFALKLNSGEIPRYYKEVQPRKVNIKEDKFNYNLPFSDYIEKQQSGLHRFNNKWYQIFNTSKEKTLDIKVENEDKIIVIKKTNNAISVLANEDASINGYTLLKGKQYNINFGTFGGIAGEEYFINKDVIKYLPSKKNQLIDSLAEVIKNN